QFDRVYLDIEPLVSTEHARRERALDRRLVHELLHIIGPFDGPASELDDQILGPQPGALSRASVGYLDHLHAGRTVEPDPSLGRQRAGTSSDEIGRASCRERV